MIKSCFLCGRWDGTNLWAQWDSGGLAVQGEVCFRKNAGVIWGPWTQVINQAPGKEAPCWQVIRTWKQGYDARLRICLSGEPQHPTTLMATEVTFARSEALFEISTESKPVRYLVNPASKVARIFTQVVDGGQCSYQLEQDLELEPGQKKQVWLKAVQSTAWHQLDQENHFVLRPSMGVTIRNLGPSRNDVVVTGRGFTTLAMAALDGPIIMAFGAQNF